MVYHKAHQKFEEKENTYFLVPLIVQNVPSTLLVAVHLSPATSLPANASEIASEMNFFPDMISGTILALRAGDPKFRIGGKPITIPPYFGS